MRKGRFVIAAIVALFAIIGYFAKTTLNPVTGEKQRVGGITAEQEIALGLDAAPQMAREFGGLSDDSKARALVEEIGNAVVSQSSASKSPYSYGFHVLDDERTVNAFALPGGQIFITEALLYKLKTRGQVAGVLGHEVGHVVGRHAAEHMAKAQLQQGLTGAAVLATYDPDRPGGGLATAQMAALVNQMISMKYGREDETESDRLGVRFMAEAGYDPRALIKVMDVLEEASGGGSGPEFMKSHPDPGNRRESIKAEIAALFPSGLPSGLRE